MALDKRNKERLSVMIYYCFILRSRFFTRKSTGNYIFSRNIPEITALSPAFANVIDAKAYKVPVQLKLLVDTTTVSCVGSSLALPADHSVTVVLLRMANVLVIVANRTVLPNVAEPI